MSDGRWSQLPSLPQPTNFPASRLSSFFNWGRERGYTIWGLRVFGSVLMVEWKMPFTVAGQTGNGRLPCHASVSSPILHSTRLACGCLRPFPDFHTHQRWLNRARFGLEPVTWHLQLREAHQRLKMPRGCLYRSRWLPCCPAGPADYGCTHQL